MIGKLIDGAMALGMCFLMAFFLFGLFLIGCAWTRELYWLCGGN